ncbi:hypothetical protein F751_2585 [Auxenochlorella protothecoides]|uniref:Transcription initiation factor TFIID component TAF4 C-terminal domain-containing protein n=1 Tax=Auxenochlorella protothecoides TaxID=3075 RepID=A0A087SJ39_AUXPR|nr:hypothetical protein F751_2585 [Auxenochlorella protothecoides]KFM25743.1 hypothetical protein F751_2585 [Auxenochlorella protothecoides]
MDDELLRDLLTLDGDFSGQAPSRTLSRSVAPFLAKFSPAHWHMLFGALHKYDSGSKARLEAIFVQRYPKLKAAAATSTEAYVAVGFKMLEALLEFLPEDRLISFMHKKDRDGDIDEILGADAFIDMEQETDTLMAGLQVQRTQGLASVAASQTLSEWRLGNECVKQMRAAGLKVLKPECFEVIQRAFQSQAETLLRRAMAVARHRQDNARRQPGVSVTHDPRRGVLGLERAARAAAEAKLAAEREALLKAAGSRRADEETKERAQKAKAELAGRAQASAANAAVAATLGGKGGRFARFERLGAAGLGAKLFGGPAKVTEETETLTLPDLLTAMERDRHYAKSSLLYTWRNRLVQG